MLDVDPTAATPSIPVRTWDDEAGPLDPTAFSPCDIPVESSSIALRNLLRPCADLEAHAEESDGAGDVLATLDVSEFSLLKTYLASADEADRSAELAASELSDRSGELAASKQLPSAKVQGLETIASPNNDSPPATVSLKFAISRNRMALVVSAAAIAAIAIAASVAIKGRRASRT
jgi:hypothetical protein